MLATALQTIRGFFSSRQNLLALGTLPALGVWIYSRVWMVNPAILGDEYLYSMNARKVSPWDPPVAGDFSNYLFNFVYQGTNLCGDAFYMCGKVFNITFFLGFVLIIFVVGRRFLPFWATYGFMVAAALSPLNVYTSMFLPESMYFFFMGLVFLATLRAMNSFDWKNWAIVGVSIGVASLVKPHAWLSAIAVGISLLIVGLGSGKSRISRTLIGITALGAGAAVARVVIGFLVAGPKVLGFFGQYLGVSTFEEVTSGLSSSGGETVAGGLTPIGGVAELFLPQLNTHFLTISALMAIGVIGTIVGLIRIFQTRELQPITSFSLFAFIWLATMTIEIVMFTGWVTGTGDDHTTRVLIRYYDFLFVIVPLAGLSVFASRLGEKTNVFFRWGLAGAFLLAISPAYTGFFGTLTIQIADAPTLAGLVTNATIFNLAALAGFVSLMVFAAFPAFSKWSFVFLLAMTMVANGWQTQEQYQLARGVDNAADIVGTLIREELSEEQLSRTWVVSTSRFEATNVAIWADSRDLKFDLYYPDTLITDSLIPIGTEFVVVMNGLSLEGERRTILSGDGYQVVSLNY